MEEYKDYMDYCDVEPLKILKHVSTRWLSLQKCISRILLHWPALSSYFNSHKDVEKEGRIKRVASLLNNPEMKLYFQFLEFILIPLNEFNTAFQASAAKIGVLHTEITKLLRKFLGKFVQVKIISSCKDICLVPYQNPENQHPDEYLAIGPKNRSYLVDCQEDISSATVNKFFRHVRNFYCKVVEKMIQKFPFEDDTLKCMGFLNPQIKDKLLPDSVMKLAEKFPGMLDDHDAATLQDEFMDYQLTPADELPKCESEQDIGHFWGEMADLFDIFLNKHRFSILSRLACTFLCLPNSNADSERAFSIVKKIHTEFRHDLQNDTLCSLLSCKMNCTYSCHEFTPSPSLLKNAKSAVVEYNNSLK